MNGARTKDRILRRRFVTHLKHYSGLWISLPALTAWVPLLLVVLLHQHFVLQPGIIVQVPTAPFVGGLPPSTLVVSITHTGNIFFNDEKVPLEKLADALSQSLNSHPGEPLVIEADEKVPHQMLVNVYHQAITVGISNILIATRPPALPSER